MTKTTTTNEAVVATTTMFAISRRDKGGEEYEIFAVTPSGDQGDAVRIIEADQSERAAEGLPALDYMFEEVDFFPTATGRVI